MAIFFSVITLPRFFFEKTVQVRNLRMFLKMTEINQRVKRDFYLLRRAMAFPVYSVRFKGEKKGVAAILIDALCMCHMEENPHELSEIIASRLAPLPLICHSKKY